MAKDIKRHITHIKSKVVENNAAKLPAAADLEYGEIAVNYAKGHETLSIKNESGDVVTFNTDTFYGTCTTAAATKDKVVTLSNASGWRLKSGVIVGVKFSNSNSFSGGTNGYPTLNVNSSGAKYIWYNTTSANTGTNNTAYGTANRISYYMYDGIGWVWVNQSVDNNTTYSTMSAAELSAGTATSQRVMTAANLKTGGNAIWQAKGSYLTGTTKYAGASTQGGAATSAEKLSNTAAIGSATNPVFFTANGVPSACTYSLNKTVPSDAVFTDTKVTAVGNHYTPTATSANTKSATASSTSELNWGSAVVTGVTLSGDAKGHITSVTVVSGKLKTPVTGVTLASGTNNGTVKLTVNGSATDNIAVKGLNSMAYQATTSYSSATQVNTALSNLNTAITTHTADTSIHVTQALLDRIAYLENKVIYNGHQYVEIGGLKWATMNIGASQPSDYGLHFQWGDTQGYTAEQVGSGEGQKYFGWADYKYGNGKSSPGATGMTKYNATDGKTVLEAEDDAAVANWGGSWRMPTTAEFKALKNAVNTAWTQVNNVYGILCTDKTDSSKTLFFPAAGSYRNGSVSNVDTSGVYWSSSSSSFNRLFAFHLSFSSSGANWGDSSNRFIGSAVRPVIG